MPYGLLAASIREEAERLKQQEIYLTGRRAIGLQGKLPTGMENKQVSRCSVLAQREHAGVANKHGLIDILFLSSSSKGSNRISGGGRNTTEASCFHFSAQGTVLGSELCKDTQPEEIVPVWENPGKSRLYLHVFWLVRHVPRCTV